MSNILDVPLEAIELNKEAADWRDVIRIAGDLLTKVGITTDKYTDEMIAAVEEHGPYIVLTPHIALAHTQQSPSVLSTGLSFATLKQPIEFGAGENDPVQLVIGLASTDPNGHLEAIQELATILGDSDFLAKALHAGSKEEFKTLLINN
ncbi:MAG: PTS sugar transporter subunit IIA [Bifidobacteriaceae bacterium]|jgi:PTS system ascorbate-specific IIA component|nr:PTS sugar transporter subunit IIA [Bifidobacteriaceae bacterium]